ncbi:MAG: Crp/Fnr family transcriptional regulator [Tissierellia bacterium]|nr:Crp/Fnr family transcriptional regulator [Tissierellia bacterium]
MNFRDYLSTIKKNSLFKNFPEEQLIRLFTINNHKIGVYQKDSIIYNQNQTCNTLDIILKGTVSVQRIDEKGNVLTVSEFNEKESLGGNLIFANKNIYPMTVVAKINAKILHMKKDLVLELCKSNNNFQKQFITSISNKTTIISDKLKSVKMKTIRQNIIEFLISENYNQKTLKVNLNMTKKEWAEKLGVQRPSLSRELMKMKKEGLIDYDKDSILIKDINFFKN